MDIITLNWIRKNISSKLNKDIPLIEFFYNMKSNKDYLNKVKTELTMDINNFQNYGTLISTEFLDKRIDELKYINYLINKEL